MTRVYHGSKHQFERFNFENLRLNGTSYGVGFYMTDNPQMAKSYAVSHTDPHGFIYEIEFHGQKPLSLTDLTLSDDDLYQLFDVLNDRCEFLWIMYDLSSMPYQKALQQAYEAMWDDNDVDLIAGIINTCGDAEIVLTTLYELFGYDCIIAPIDETQTFYIATVNEAITILSCLPVVYSNEQ